MVEFSAIEDKPFRRYQLVMGKEIGPFKYKILDYIPQSLPFRQGDLVICQGQTKEGLPIVFRKLTKHEIEQNLLSNPNL